MLTDEDRARLELIRDHDGNDLSDNDQALLTRLAESTEQVEGRRVVFKSNGHEGTVLAEAHGLVRVVWDEASRVAGELKDSWVQPGDILPRLGPLGNPTVELAAPDPKDTAPEESAGFPEEAPAQPLEEAERTGFCSECGRLPARGQHCPGCPFYEKRWRNPKSRWLVHETLGEWPNGSLAYNLHNAEGGNQATLDAAFEVIPAEYHDRIVSSLQERLESLEGSYGGMKRARTAALKERDNAREKREQAEQRADSLEKRLGEGRASRAHVAEGASVDDAGAPSSTSEVTVTLSREEAKAMFGPTAMPNTPRRRSQDAAYNKLRAALANQSSEDRGVER